MPGRTPSAAYKAFAKPIQESIACLKGQGKVTCSPGGRSDKDQTQIHSWMLNGDNGLQNGRLHFRALMLYSFTERPDELPGERWKISTRGYKYQIAVDAEALIEWHWHPDSTLGVVFPHLHLQKAALTNKGVITPRSHIPAGRTSLESVIRALIAEFKWPPTSGDWSERLALNESVFRLYATWSQGQQPQP
ncbi:MAG: hypothetical protein U0990_00735 [Candidatus Nanopelagicales bacterium]|nr:hypothetical protein [Candidatus Nanopelagicales bacterium]MDZ4248601.1 hypothetical protein [Candidatus Nanopelagicales bacterium]